MDEHITFVFTSDGTVRAIYDDRLLSLFDRAGTCVIQRASHVEPAQGGWTADMSPCRGPLLGPFRTRQEALEKEREWLLTHGIPFPGENAL